MDIPSAILIKLLTKRGTLFVIQDGEFFQGGGTHTFLVCNSGSIDKIVILLVATSQLQKKIEFVERRGFPLETIVHFGRNEYPHFKQVTAFNCNEYHVTEIDRLAALLGKGRLKVITNTTLSGEHMSLIEAGICLSPTVPPEIQALVRSSDH